MEHAGRHAARVAVNVREKQSVSASLCSRLEMSEATCTVFGNELAAVTGLNVCVLFATGSPMLIMSCDRIPSTKTVDMPVTA